VDATAPEFVFSCSVTMIGSEARRSLSSNSKNWTLGLCFSYVFSCSRPVFASRSTLASVALGREYVLGAVPCAFGSGFRSHRSADEPPSRDFMG